MLLLLPGILDLPLCNLSILRSFSFVFPSSVTKWYLTLTVNETFVSLWLDKLRFCLDITFVVEWVLMICIDCCYCSGQLSRLSDGFLIERWRIQIPAGAVEEFSSPELTFWIDSYSIDVRSTPVLPQWHVKDAGHSAKSTGGRLHLNTLTPLT